MSQFQKTGASVVAPETSGGKRIALTDLPEPLARALSPLSQGDGTVCMQVSAGVSLGDEELRCATDSGWSGLSLPCSFVMLLGLGLPLMHPCPPLHTHRPSPHQELGTSLKHLPDWKSSDPLSSIPLTAFPPSVRTALASLDKTGTGFVLPADLATAAGQYVTEQRTRRKALRCAVGVSFCVVFLLAAIFGVCYASLLFLWPRLRDAIEELQSIVAGPQAIQNTDGVVLRTAAGSMGEVPFKPTASRRELHDSAVSMINWAPFEYAGHDMVHFRRPVEFTTTRWDRHGRALQASPTPNVNPGKRPIPDSGAPYQVLGTVPVASFITLCKLFKEGHSSIHATLPVTPSGATEGASATNYNVVTAGQNLWGCDNYATNGYGAQALLYYSPYALPPVAQAAATPTPIPSLIIILVDCNTLDPDAAGRLCTVSLNLNPTRRRALRVAAGLPADDSPAATPAVAAPSHDTL